MNTNINAALHNVLPITSVVLIYIFTLILLIMSPTFNEVTAFRAFIFYSRVMSYGYKYCALKSVICLSCAKYNNLIINSSTGQGHREKQRSLLLHVWNVLIHFFFYRNPPVFTPFLILLPLNRTHLISCSRRSVIMCQFLRFFFFILKVTWFWTNCYFMYIPKKRFCRSRTRIW